MNEARNGDPSTEPYKPFCVGEPYTVDDVIRGLDYPRVMPLLAPEYVPGDTALNKRVALAVPSMARHTTNEGWELMLGLHHAGYVLHGFGLDGERMGWQTHVPDILRLMNPGVVVVQDKREWEGRTAGPGFDTRESFTGVEALAGWNNRFKVTVLKDAHANPLYHRASAEEMGANAWITYYHPRIVSHLAPYVRQSHLIRTYHTIDSDLFKTGRLAVDISLSEKRRAGALISGAVSGAYPLRKRIIEHISEIPYLCRLVHPGYHRRGCETPKYLEILSGYKVAICTASRYGYALRKIVEATAVGCKVVTDLPVDDVMPFIDGNLVRVRPDIPIQELKKVITTLYDTWEPRAQEFWASLARTYYDYRRVGLLLAEDIERLRRGYKT
jgi:hypothetical protein